MRTFSINTQISNLYLVKVIFIKIDFLRKCKCREINKTFFKIMFYQLLCIKFVYSFWRISPLFYLIVILS